MIKLELYFELKSNKMYLTLKFCINVKHRKNKFLLECPCKPEDEMS